MPLTKKQANELADAFEDLGYAFQRESESSYCSCLFLMALCVVIVTGAILLALVCTGVF
jgi:hypothetical protein